MFLAIPLAFGDFAGDGYSCHRESGLCEVTHSFGDECLYALLDSRNTLVSTEMTLSPGKVSIDLPASADAELFTLQVASFGNAQAGGNAGSADCDDFGPYETEHYSGTVDTVMLFLKSLNVSGDRLAATPVANVDRMQELVDRAIDGTLCEYYFTPLCHYNQVMPNGKVKKLFPGKIRLLALHWTAGLMLETEFQNLEPNMNEQGKAFVEESKKELQQMVDFSTVIPGQRRKHPCPTMPPNLAPSKTNQFQL